jgi:5-methylcytosine-specific restriction endonuclease McrA
VQNRIDILWDKLRPIIKSKSTDTEISLDESEFRLDDCGAIVRKSEFGQKTDFGWNIDHILPISKGGDDKIENLDALHWRNNEAKGNSFPTFSYTTAAKKPLIKAENETKLRVRLTFSKTTLDSLAGLYPDIYRII